MREKRETRIKGIIPPILTPFYEDESVNYEELRNQVNRMIEAGVHGLFPFGTNGEAYALSNDEKIEILKVVVDRQKAGFLFMRGQAVLRQRIRSSFRCGQKKRERIFFPLSRRILQQSPKMNYMHIIKR